MYVVNPQKLQLHALHSTTRRTARNDGSSCCYVKFKNLHFHINCSLGLFMSFVDLDTEIQQARLAVLEDASLQVALALGELDKAAHAILACACIVAVELAVEIFPSSEVNFLLVLRPHVVLRCVLELVCEDIEECICIRCRYV